MNRRVTIIVLTAGLIAACVFPFLFDSGVQISKPLPDGTRFMLSDVQIGKTNVFERGSQISRRLSRLIPQGGVKFLGVSLQRTTKVYVTNGGPPTLGLELQPLAASPRAEAIMRSFWPDSATHLHRLLISGRDDFAFVEDFEQGVFPNLLQLDTASFPRAESRWRMRVQERQKDNSADWSDIASFNVENPAPAKPASWTGEKSVHLQIAAGVEADVGPLTVSRDRWMDNRGACGEYTARLPLRVTTDGKFSPAWEITDDLIQDASGNESYFPPQEHEVKSNSIVYYMTRPLDPAYPWKIHLEFSQSSDFPAEDVHEITGPLLTTIKTNIGGFEATVRLSTISKVEIPSEPQHMRLTFLEITDDNGTSVKDHVEFNDHYHFSVFTKPLSRTRPIRLTFALHPTYSADFTLVPQVEGVTAP